MDNVFSKRYDGVNLYLEFAVKTKLIGKLFLSLFILLYFIVIFYLTINSSKDENNNSEFITAAIISTFVLIVFPVRYLIWNCYGKEFIIINNKSLSYYYSYKFLETNLKTKLINELSIAIEVVKEDETDKYGRLIFYNISEETNLNEFLFQTSVLLKYQDLELIRKEIFNVFFDEHFKELNSKNMFKEIYLN